MIRLGYVGINTMLPTASKTFRLANFSEERMLSTAAGNIGALSQILQWNLEHNISVFRITSGLIPFGSHKINSGKWMVTFSKELKRIGDFVKANGMRVSMHPGQYTVINTPTEAYYIRSIKDLEYHCAVLDLLKVDSSHKIIIHGGGVYQDKERSTKILTDRLSRIEKKIVNRLVVENDERNFNAEQIYEICKKTKLPGVLDIFHHQCFPSFNDLSLREIILLYKSTWPLNQRQKIHYSNQAPKKHRGAHSEGIDVQLFGEFYKGIKDLDLDIMLETKDKQESVLKLKKSFPELL